MKKSEGVLKQLNSSKNKAFSDLPINRGVELLLGGGPKPQKVRPFGIRFGKLFSLFKREIDFYFEVSFNIRKKTLGEEP